MNKKTISFLLFYLCFVVILVGCQNRAKRCGTEGCRCDKLVLSDDDGCRYLAVNIKKK